MSLDLYLRTEPCEHCGSNGEELASFNYTYNASSMWYAATPGAQKMVYIDGMTGAESAPVLKAAIKTLEADPDRFIAMQPPNGWGSYATFVPWLKSVLTAAEQNPTAVWSAWR